MAATDITVPADARVVLADVIEGFCPLCKVQLVVHSETDLACCPCGGCSYRARETSITMTTCPEHPPRHCPHWGAVWRAIADGKLGESG
jgi:hypothetical protein